MLVNDILDAASSKRETLVVKQDLVNLKEVAEVVCGLLAPLVNRNVQLVCELDDSLPAVLGDETRICSILTNLASNAAKFTKEGQIEVSAAVVEQGKVMRVEVSDTGLGIPEDKLPMCGGQSSKLM